MTDQLIQTDDELMPGEEFEDAMESPDDETINGEGDSRRRRLTIIGVGAAVLAAIAA